MILNELLFLPSESHSLEDCDHRLHVLLPHPQIDVTLFIMPSVISTMNDDRSSKKTSNPFSSIASPSPRSASTLILSLAHFELGECLRARCG